MKIDGRSIAAEIYEDLKNRVGDLQKKSITPHLAIIIVGEDPASIAYINQKQKWGNHIGAKITVLTHPISVTTKELENKINELNNNPNVHAILIQRPLPPQIDTKKLDLLINPQKDIDAFHPDSPYTPPIALAVLKILNEIHTHSHSERSDSVVEAPPRSSKYHWGESHTTNPDSKKDFEAWLQSKQITILGKGQAGGKPLYDHLRKLNLNPILIDSKTPNPEKLTKESDIIITAVGKPHILASNKIKKNAIIIGIGISRAENGKLQGDFQESDITTKASYYTPTPGGTGPVNVAMLMNNLVTAAEAQTMSLRGGTTKQSR